MSHGWINGGSWGSPDLLSKYGEPPSAEDFVAGTDETSSAPKNRAKTSDSHEPFCHLPSDEFSSKTALFDGPRVVITVGDTPKKTYHLPKALLVNASPYFAAAFEGGFIEGVEQKIELGCTITAFDLLVQFLYTGTFKLPRSLNPPQEISALLDLCVLLDMLLIENCTKALGVMKSLLVRSERHLQPEHVRKAVTELPSGHAVRKLFAEAMVQVFVKDRHLPRGRTNFRFKEEVKELDIYAADMARAFMEIARTRSSTSLSYRNLLTRAVFHVYDSPENPVNTPEPSSVNVESVDSAARDWLASGWPGDSGFM
ncbi:BTB POZ fold protein [Rutstroemia sp. NJR-2017a WRK4]|nr:BTB POZ fold protein [Rutstroemia sp. NJR-2017a WRK4]